MYIMSIGIINLSMINHEITFASLIMIYQTLLILQNHAFKTFKIYITMMPI